MLALQASVVSQLSECKAVIFIQFAICFSQIVRAASQCALSLNLLLYIAKCKLASFKLVYCLKHVL